MKLPAVITGLAFWGCSAAFSVAADPDEGRPKNERNPPSPDRFIRFLDKDGDQLVSWNEFSAHMPRHGMERLQAADTDGDGNISREEMEAALAERRKREEAKATERFDLADANNDGFVTPDEIKQVMFNNMDLNSDGYISPKEFGKARKFRQGRHDSGYHDS